MKGNKTLPRWPACLLGGLSLAYFVALRWYERESRVDFSLVWLILALAIPFADALLGRYGLWRPASSDATSKQVHRTIRRWRILIRAILAVGVAIGSLILGYICLAPIPRPTEPDYLVVLGGGLKRDGSPGNAPILRLEAAAAYAQAHPSVRIVLTGGQLPGTPCAEGDSMKRYLTETLSVPADRVLAETEAQNTIENMANSLRLILADSATVSSAVSAADPGATPGNAAGNPPSICVLTSDFHIARALLLARRTGIVNPTGMACRTPAILVPNVYLREILAYGKLAITVSLASLKSGG